MTLIHNSLPLNNRLTLSLASQHTEFSTQTFRWQNFCLNKEVAKHLQQNTGPPSPLISQLAPGQPGLGYCEEVAASPRSGSVPHPALSLTRPSADAPPPRAQIWVSLSSPQVYVLSCSDSKCHSKASQPRCPNGKHSRKPALCFCSLSSLLPPQRAAGGTRWRRATQRKHIHQIASADVFTHRWSELRAHPWPATASCWPSSGARTGLKPAFSAPTGGLKGWSFSASGQGKEISYNWNKSFVPTFSFVPTLPFHDGTITLGFA